MDTSPSASGLVAWRRDEFRDAGQPLRLPGFPLTGLASASPIPTVGLSGTWLQAPPVRAVLVEEEVFDPPVQAPALMRLLHEDYCMGPGSLEPIFATRGASSPWTAADQYMHCAGRRWHVSQLDQRTLDRARLQAASPTLARLLAEGRPLRSNLCRLRVGQRYRLAILPSDALGKLIDTLAAALRQVRPHWRPALYPAPRSVLTLPQVSGALTLLVEQSVDGGSAARRLSALKACLPNVDIAAYALRHGSETRWQALHRSNSELSALTGLGLWEPGH